MNIPRLILAIIAGFIVIFGTDLLIHVVWLKPDYEAMKSVFRPEAEMEARRYWMFVAQILCAVTFVVIWAKGFAGRDVGTGAMFGLLMGLFQQIWAIVTYVILPMPSNLAMKWFFVGILQAMLLGIVTALVYKPAQPTVSAA